MAKVRRTLSPLAMKAVYTTHSKGEGKSYEANIGTDEKKNAKWGKQTNAIGVV